MAFLMLLNVATSFGGVPAIDENSDAYKAAQRTAEKNESAEVQDQIKAQMNRLKPIIEKQKREVYRGVIEKKQKPGTSDKTKVLVFISASMPNTLITQFAQSAQKLKETHDTQFIINGIPKRGLDQFIKNIKGDQLPISLSVDPFMFEAFGIESVPAVVINGQYSG